MCMAVVRPGFVSNLSTARNRADAPLQTRTQPPLILFYGTCQIGRRVYRFGGHDFTNMDAYPVHPEVWEFDIE